MEILTFLKQSVTNLESTRETVTRHLSNEHKSRLLATSNHGRNIILEIEGRGSSRRRTAVTDDRSRQLWVARQTVLSHDLKIIEAKIGVLKDAITRLKALEQDRGRYALDNFNWFSNEEIEECLRLEPAGSWSSEDYERSDYRQEERTMMTSFGLYVRSKSELLIAEMLHKYGLGFRYEQVYHIGKYTIIADFTIRRADGKIFIWEHEGLVNSRSYIDWQRRKSELYAEAGFFPWDNLIVTYDTKDGGIDLRIVESEIRNKLLL